MATNKQFLKALEERQQFGQLDPILIMNTAKAAGEKLSREDIKNHQLRRFFEAIKGIERHITTGRTESRELSQDAIAELVFLKPHLINAGKRQKSKEFERFTQFVEEMLQPEYFKNSQDLKRFIQFFEAVIAYHS